MLTDRQEKKVLSKIISVYSTFFSVPVNESYKEYIKNDRNSQSTLQSYFKSGTKEDHFSYRHWGLLTIQINC